MTGVKLLEAAIANFRSAQQEAIRSTPGLHIYDTIVRWRVELLDKFRRPK